MSHKHRTSWLRYMRTTQERKWVDAVDDSEHVFKVRAKRRNIPHAWEDVPRVHCRSWKNYRNHQWRDNA